MIGVGTYIYYAENVLETILGPFVPYLTRGNVQATENLTGRVPLWQALIEQVWQHPWLGAGFAAFWSPVNLSGAGIDRRFGAGVSPQRIPGRAGQHGFGGAHHPLGVLSGHPDVGAESGSEG